MFYIFIFNSHNFSRLIFNLGCARATQKTKTHTDSLNRIAWTVSIRFDCELNVKNKIFSFTNTVTRFSVKSYKILLYMRVV